MLLLVKSYTPTSCCIWHPCPECHEASKHHLLKFDFLLLVQFNLGFITEGRLAAVLIIPSSWGSQRAILTSHQLLQRSAFALGSPNVVVRYLPLMLSDTARQWINNLVENSIQTWFDMQILFTENFKGTYK
jgi:hypothetical protein